MGILEFILWLIGIPVGGFMLIVMTSIIADYKLNKRIKNEYEESKNFKEDK